MLCNHIESSQAGKLNIVSSEYSIKKKDLAVRQKLRQAN